VAGDHPREARDVGLDLPAAQQFDHRPQHQGVQLDERPLRRHARRQVRAHVLGEERRRLGLCLPDLERLPPAAADRAGAVRDEARRALEHRLERRQHAVVARRRLSTHVRNHQYRHDLLLLLFFRSFT
jgi:hypothetical protein